MIVLVDMNGQRGARIVWPRIIFLKSVREDPYSFILKDRISLGRMGIQNKERQMSGK